ncbi:hypothetical protein P5673_024132, partial [Acropora cervicornis]
FRDKDEENHKPALHKEYCLRKDSACGSTVRQAWLMLTLGILHWWSPAFNAFYAQNVLLFNNLSRNLTVEGRIVTSTRFHRTNNHVSSVFLIAKGNSDAAIIGDCNWNHKERCNISFQTAFAKCN